MGSHSDALGHAVNFGTGEAVAVLELARQIVELSDSKSEIVHVEPRTAEVDRLCCDPSRARRLFGWKPEVDLREGLRRNIAWARATW